jgi:hypothetical protein
MPGGHGGLRSKAERTVRSMPEREAELHREPRWQPALAVVAALALYVTLPPRLIIGPSWLAPLLTLVILIPLLIVVPRRHVETRRIRFWGIVLIAIVNFFNLASVLLLVAGFFHPEKTRIHGAALILRSGLQIWLTNILVFGLWYWELDANGPDARAGVGPAVKNRNVDFLFPQMQMAGYGLRCIDERWRPQFYDYLYLAFTNSTAFSPADVMPLSRWAKGLMTVEAMISLITIAIVFSRAVGLL